MSLLPFLSGLTEIKTLSDKPGEVAVYSSVEDELAAMHTAIACRDISEHFLLSVSGSDSLDFLHRISTNSLKDLPVAGTRKTVFTNEKGRILDSVHLFRLEDKIRFLGHNGTGKVLRFWLNKFIITDDVKVSDDSSTHAALQLFGPQIPSLLILLFGDEAKSLAPDVIHQLSRPEGKFSIALLPESGPDEQALLFGDTAAIQGLLSAAFAFSKEGLVEFTMIGEAAYEDYRIDHGMPGHNELNDRFNPHEALLTPYIDFHKGCYIGQEVIARLETYNKVQKYLRSFVFRENLPANCLPLLYDADDNEVGLITSNVYSKRLNTGIGLGYIHRDHAAPGTKVTAMYNGNPAPVTVKMPGNL